MDQRRELRVEADQAVRVSVLDENPVEMEGRVVNLSSKGLRLLLEGPVAPETPVKVVWENRLLLGEICYCECATQGYYVGISLAHALLDTTELANLSRRLLGELPEETRPLVKPRLS